MHEVGNQKQLKKEFLSFKLGREEYGLDIQRVQEIRGYETVTPVPGAPAFIKGLVNLRGAIVPIVDLRIKLDFGPGTYDEQTVVIILSIKDKIVGIVVDGVSDVLTPTDDQIKSVPDMGSTIDTECVTGLASIDERMVILIDIEKLITSPEMGLDMDISRNN